MEKDRLYGGMIFAASLIMAIAYLAAFFAPQLALPAWLSWLAIALPVFLFTMAVLVICMWIGWTMLTTPPPPPIEASERSEEKPGK
jgi:preprotein translocase subunit SecY